jgi:hypothetical protein
VEIPCQHCARYVLGDAHDYLQHQVGCATRRTGPEGEQASIRLSSYSVRCCFCWRVPRAHLCALFLNGSV